MAPETRNRLSVPDDGVMSDVIDHHNTAPTEADRNIPHSLFNMVGHICMITPTSLRIVRKIYDSTGAFSEFRIITLSFPTEFNGIWCRFFFRETDAHILVMDYNKQDIIVYDIGGNMMGRWMLTNPLPEDAFLTAIETIPDSELFELIYIIDGDEYRHQMSFADEQFQPFHQTNMIAVH